MFKFLVTLRLLYFKFEIAKGPIKPTNDRYWNQSGKIGPHCLFSSNIPESLRRKARENCDNNMRKKWTESHIEIIAKVLLHEILRNFI